MAGIERLSPLLKSFVYLIIGLSIAGAALYQLLNLFGVIPPKGQYSLASIAFSVPTHCLILGSYFRRVISLKTMGMIYIETMSAVIVTLIYTGEENFKSLRLLMFFCLSYTQSYLTEPTILKVWHSIKPIIIITALEIATGHIEIKSLWHAIIIFKYSLLATFSILAMLDNEALKTETMRNLKEVKNQLSTVLSAIPVGIFVLTNQDEIFSSNSAALRFLGCNSPSQIKDIIEGILYTEGSRQLGGVAQSLFQDLRYYIARHDEAPVTFGHSLIGEKTLQWIGQKTTWNRQPAAIIVITDITQAVLLLEQVQNESDFKNVILRSVSHELKTPTNAIIHAVSTVLVNDNLTPAVKCKLQIADVSSRSLLMLIRDFLDYSAFIAGRFSLSLSRFGLRQCLNECIELICLAADKKDIRIVKHFDPRLPETVYTDQSRLSQVLLNIVSNAVKFTYRGGRIDVRAVLNDLGQMEVSVTDTGIGISHDHLQAIFSCFNTVQGSASINRQGTGLGLNISNMLAKELGGSPIQVESRLNEGSCFKFIVGIGNPIGRAIQILSETLYNEEPHESAQPVHIFNIVLRRFPPVLVVDDTSFNRLVIVDILASAGIDCGEADSGQEAFDYVISRAVESHPVEVIVMDFEMPGMNGPTTSKLILEKLTELMLPLPQIIAHTAYSSEADKKICREAGMIDFMPKPSTSDFIVSMVKRHRQT